MIPKPLQYKHLLQPIHNKKPPAVVGSHQNKTMRGFIILCLTGLTAALPQGYNYYPSIGSVSSVHGFAGNAGGQGQHGLDFNNVITGSSVFHNSGIFSSEGQTLNSQTFHQANHVPTTAAVATSNNLIQQQQQQQKQQQPHQQEQPQQVLQLQPHHPQPHPNSLAPTIVSKRFFIHTAPEDHDDDDNNYNERHITVGVPRKNYNIVFIKAPVRSNKKTTLKISPAPNEDKTIIYVLNKKADISDVHTEVLEQPTATHKPEVFFIKYKTNEEAAHAQEQIQAQYDALGGSSKVSDEGVASVSSVIGSLDGATHGVGPEAVMGSAGGAADAGGFNVASAGDTVTHTTGNGYLPPKL